MARLAAANPSIAFRLLPAPPSPDPAAHPVRCAQDTLRLANPALRAFLRALPAPADALLLGGAAEVDRSRARELRAPVPVGGEEPAGGTE